MVPGHYVVLFSVHPSDEDRFGFRSEHGIAFRFLNFDIKAGN